MPEFIHIWCPIVAGKYKKLSPANRAVADRGIRQAHANCQRFGCDLDMATIHEIINDARCGIAIYSENEKERMSSQPLPGFTSSLNFDHTVHLTRRMR